MAYCIIPCSLLCVAMRLDFFRPVCGCCNFGHGELSCRRQKQNTEDGPRTFKHTELSKQTCDGSKMAQDGPKMTPRWPQDGPKMAQRWPQDGSKRPHGALEAPEPYMCFMLAEISEGRAQYISEVNPYLRAQIHATGSTIQHKRPNRHLCAVGNQKGYLKKTHV